MSEPTDRNLTPAEPEQGGSLADEQQQSPGLHVALTNLQWLVGTWWGFGVGGYPTIEGFRFEQEIVFSHDGRPFLKYESRSWLIDDDGNRIRPAASELGWWRPGATANELEVLLAHHTGIVEVYVGDMAFHKIELATDVVARTQTAKEVNALKRLYGKVEEDLAYAIDMAAEGQQLQAHLSARLQRV
ncbi:MAG: hypothetical protein QOE84_3226 [Actinomycetota bacterium]|nr:hypothetical protein [Actinomycetota bacterium]